MSTLSGSDATISVTLRAPIVDGKLRIPDGATIVGDLDLPGMQITELPDNLSVKGYLDLSNMQITELADNLSVGGSLNLRGTPITQLPTISRLVATSYRDVKIVDDEGSGETILEIDVRGKRGVGYCKSTANAVPVFKRLMKRNSPKPVDLIFPTYQHDIFNRVLDEEGLKFDREGQRRSFHSLRHTYICFRLMEGADIHQIAKNCRTSVEMIEKYTPRTSRTSSMRRRSTSGGASRQSRSSRRSRARRSRCRAHLSWRWNPDAL